MTHEDLLDVIDFDEGSENSEKVFNALRAVVELHKPEQVYDNLNRINKLYCDHCDTYDNPTFYPCPTIQAIEKELQ